MILETIKNRRSIRKFKPTPVTKEQTQLLLEAAMLSPSACNTRPWRFIAVTNRQMLDKLAEEHSHAKMLATAQLAIIVVALPATQEGNLNGLPYGFYPQDCGAATQNILLQAEAMGLGSCWCGVYPKGDKMAALSALFEIPKGELPFSLIAIGEKDEEPKRRGKYEEEKVTWIQ